MAKRPPIGKCVHCLKDSVERNWDHVFPVGWYPDTTPANIDKWKAPSCLACNSALGRVESRFISLIALTLDPKVRETAGIPQKVLRSLKPEFARNEVDALARTAAAKRVTASIYHGPFEARNVYPTAGTEAARARSDQIPFLIPRNCSRKSRRKSFEASCMSRRGGSSSHRYEFNFLRMAPICQAASLCRLSGHMERLWSASPGFKSIMQ